MESMLNPHQIKSLAEEVRSDGFCLLRDHFSKEKLKLWYDRFLPLLMKHIETEGHLKNRGTHRYYVTLPFTDIWADPKIYEDPDVLAICENLVGPDMVMCQLATDTPLKGSVYQEIHRDAPPLFPELEIETPPFQLAVNFPLVDVNLDNGPFEVGRGTHMMSKEEGIEKIESGEIEVEPITMNVGDVMIRDVRGLHRGTPNKSRIPRPMVVIGFSRRWLFRPEVKIQIPRYEHEKLSDRARQLLRYNPIVESLDEIPKGEIYQSFAY